MTAKQEQLKKIAESRAVALSQKRHAELHLDTDWFDRQEAEAILVVEKAEADLARLRKYRNTAQSGLEAANASLKKCDDAIHRIDVQPKVDKMEKLRNRIAELQAQLEAEESE